MKLICNIFLFCCSILIVGCASTHAVNQAMITGFLTEGLKAEETDRGVVVYIPVLFFESDSTRAESESIAKLQYVAEVSNQLATIKRKILIEGHANSKGTDEHNLSLSKNRALKTAERLVANGVDSGRIEATWYGESRQLIPDILDDGSENLEGLAVNRRVEIIFLNP